MVSLYYALPKEKKSDCQKFNLSVQLIPGLIHYIRIDFVLQLEFVFQRQVKYDNDVVSPADEFRLQPQPSLSYFTAIANSSRNILGHLS